MDFDIATELTTAVREPETTWEFIRRFAANWSTPLADDDGFTGEELGAAEKNLGLPLPEAVRLFHSLLGRRDDLTSNQDRLLPPHELRLDETGHALVFRDENQGCAQWGIAVADLHLPDPPVMFQLDGPRSDPEPWRPFLDRFSLASVELVLSESLFSDDLHLGDSREADDGALRTLEDTYVRSAFPAYPMWASSEDPPIRWFTGRDVLVRDDSGAWLWVRARTREALRRTREAMPGDWLMAPTR